MHSKQVFVQVRVPQHVAVYVIVLILVVVGHVML
jgi:hypothetical protein